MKRNWTTEELVEDWTLLPNELVLLDNKTGATRLGFALLLKFFQLEARFPFTKNEMPRGVVTYVANKLASILLFTCNMTDEGAQSSITALRSESSLDSESPR